MADVTRGTGTGARDRMVLGIVLLIVGAGGLALNLLDLNNFTGGWVVLAIGLGCLAAFAVTRHVGYMIPGGIISGLGFGITLSGMIPNASSETTGGVIVLGLGLGFVAVWLIGTLARVSVSHWWALIPGGILGIVGIALLIGGGALGVLEYWGVAIVAVGLILLWRAWSDGRARV